MNLHVMKIVFSYFDTCFNTILQLNFLPHLLLVIFLVKKKIKATLVKLKSVTSIFFFKNVKVSYYFIINASMCTCYKALLKFREQLVELVFSFHLYMF